MKYVKGNFYKIIFQNNGYVIGLLKLKDTNVEDFYDYINSMITFTGYFDTLVPNDTYILYGDSMEHPRFGLQFNATSFEKVKPTDKLGIITFLSSSLFPGIGEALAKKIVEQIGDNALDKILENPELLKSVPKLTEKKRITIITNLVKYEQSHKTIVNLSDMGFTMKESLDIYNIYNEYTLDKVGTDIYDVIDTVGISFSKIDKVALNLGYSKDDVKRIRAAIIYSMSNLVFENGDTYLNKDEIYKETLNILNIDYLEDFDTYLIDLEKIDKIVIDDNKYYLKTIWDDQEYIINKLNKLLLEKEKHDVDSYIKEYEKVYGINYNDTQLKAITDAIENNLLIITGGPGTGKTTIIKAIVSLYSKIHGYKPKEVDAHIALLAPTGRAAKRMSESCLLPASTIHRFLKWNKENESFAINEFNKDEHDLIIVDEVSMIDIPLLASLLRGLKNNVKLILVGDYNQLPSVGPGQLLKDLIDSNFINTICLEKIYRQNENSYITKFASDIKNNDIGNDFLDQKDDYIFLECSSFMLQESLKNIVSKMLEKDMDMNKVQIMAPMYKGENGIDKLNKIMQSLINPSSNEKMEIKTGDRTYRENDKILQLVNMPEDNVYNGDIGTIIRIDKQGSKEEVYISFDGNVIKYTSKDFNKFTLGYIISIHKSQGSEFDTVIIPMVHSYNRMLYRKLIYTAVTRAKRKLIMLGEAEAFLYAVSNDKEQKRKTDLVNKLKNV